MKLLLTSNGVPNGSIRGALVDLLGKPITEARAVGTNTAIYALKEGGAYARGRSRASRRGRQARRPHVRHRPRDGHQGRGQGGHLRGRVETAQPAAWSGHRAT